MEPESSRPVVESINVLQAKLIVVGGDAKVSEVKLRLPTTIGRGKEATLTVPHPLISRLHCELFENEEKQLVVRDLGSLNGTFVGNERITESPLSSGELLTVGTITFRAVYGNELEDPQLAPPSADTSTSPLGKTVQITPGEAIVPASVSQESPNESSDSASPESDEEADFDFSAILDEDEDEEEGDHSDLDFSLHSEDSTDTAVVLSADHQIEETAESNLDEQELATESIVVEEGEVEPDAMDDSQDEETPSDVEDVEVEEVGEPTDGASELQLDLPSAQEADSSEQPIPQEAELELVDEAPAQVADFIGEGAKELDDGEALEFLQGIDASDDSPSEGKDELNEDDDDLSAFLSQL